MDYLHEVAPLVAAYNRLVPLPADQQPTNLHPVVSDVDQPSPTAEALQRRHFRALDGGERAPPTVAPSSDDLLSAYAVGTHVDMLYDTSNGLQWYDGVITRVSSALSRDRKPDISYSIRFTNDPKIYGPYKLSCNSLRISEDAPEAEVSITACEFVPLDAVPAQPRRSTRLSRLEAERGP